MTAKGLTSNQSRIFRAVALHTLLMLLSFVLALLAAKAPPAACPDPTPSSLPAPASLPSTLPLTPYPGGRLHSPLTPAVVQRLRAVAARGPGLRSDVFMKVGDSITASHDFLGCFGRRGKKAVELGEHQELAATVCHFNRAVFADGTSSFDRRSLSAEAGAGVRWALDGFPSPLLREADALKPQFAVVLYGTNDLNRGGTERALSASFYRSFSHDLGRLLDELTEQGIVPMVSTVPHRRDRAIHVSTLNQLLRGVAYARQLPFLDYNLALARLPKLGLSGDGVHPSIGARGACVLDRGGLRSGYNVRNLVTLEGLDRLRQVVLGHEPHLDEEPPPVTGSGSVDAPFDIVGLPFVHASSLRIRGGQALRRYSCVDPQPGPELLYRLVLDRPSSIRVIVTSPFAAAACRNRGDACDGVTDVSLNLLRDRPDGEACIATGNTVIEKALAAGTYYLSVDTSPFSKQPPVGDYTLMVMRCDDGDPRCL